MCLLPSRNQGAGICKRFALAVFSCLLFDGCGDSCFLFVSKPGTGTIVVAAGGGDASCRIPKPMGAVQFRVVSSEHGSEPIGPRHIFVTLHGVVGHENSAAPLDSPGWQELAPDLAEHPVQVDLLAPVEGSNVFPASVGTKVNPGVYRQLGLRLLTSPASGNALSSEGGAATVGENACGEGTWHCAMLANGSVQPIAVPFDRNSEGKADPVLNISSEQIAGGSIVVLPDAVRAYAIRFDLRLSVSLSRNGPILLRPVFSVSPE